MKSLKWVVFLALILMLFMLVPDVQAQDVVLNIHGVVFNGTEGGGIPENLLISLHVYTADAITGEYSATADNNGAFTFTDVALVSGDEVVAFTTYEDGVYSAESFIYDPETEIPKLSIAIYESTEDSAKVFISQLTFMLSASDGQLRVGEHYLVSNAGDRTWIGTNDDAIGINTTIEFSLPPEAESLWFSGYGLDMRFFSVEGGFVDTVPVGPGNPYLEIFFSYTVPYTGSYELTKTLNLPVDNLEYLVVQEDGIAITGEGIISGEVVETGTESAFSYSSPGFEAGKTLSFEIFDQSASSIGSSLSLEIGIGLAVLVLAGLGIFWVMRRGRKGALPASADPLLVEIAKLDESYEAGNLKEAQYQKKRNALIVRVKQISK